MIMSPLWCGGTWELLPFFWRCPLLWVVTALLVSGLPTGGADSKVDCALCDETSGYIVIVDCGSTGSRAHVFHYSRRQLEAGRFPLIVDPPLTLPTRLADFSVKPGISAFINDTDGVARSLAPLLKSAADALLLHKPNVDVKHVPVYLGATAGMRELRATDRDEVMQAVRAFLRSHKNPFAFSRNEQARVLAGEEEGAFGWLALNQLQASISPDPNTTFGSLDFGGGSVQIAFVPFETSILEGIFPMHFGGSVKGPIHLYSHSFSRFGFVDAFQRAAELLHAEKLPKNSSSSRKGVTEVMEHPCLPTGLVWNVQPGEFGVSTTSPAPQRHGGPLQLRGSGSFEQCYALARKLIVADTPCFQPPCSMLGVYQPKLSRTKFVLFSAHDELLQWEVLALMEKGMPMLGAMRKQLRRICALPLDTQVELFGKKGLTHNGGQPPCWRGIWMLTMLKDGLGFPVNSHHPALLDVADCCDHSLGHATYEANFFPYRISKTSYHSLLEIGSGPMQEVRRDSPSPARVIDLGLAVGLGAVVAAGVLLAIAARLGACRSMACCSTCAAVAAVEGGRAVGWEQGSLSRSRGGRQEPLLHA